MAKISDKMATGVKDTMAVVIAECTGSDVKQTREWLDTVKTAEDFFGNNKQGLSEYHTFIRQRENDYNNAVRNSIKRV